MTDVTRILSRIAQGDPTATEQLLPLVYEALRKLAAARMAREKPGQTLPPTAWVHETSIRRVDVEKAQHGNSRGHFFAAAAEAMWRILVDNARCKASSKWGGDYERVGLSDVPEQSDDDRLDLLALDQALKKREEQDTAQCI